MQHAILDALMEGSDTAGGSDTLYEVYRDMVGMGLREAHRYESQQHAIMHRLDQRDTLKNVGKAGVPTLVACGDSDALIPFALQKEMFTLVDKSAEDGVYRKFQVCRLPVSLKWHPLHQYCFVGSASAGMWALVFHGSPKGTVRSPRRLAEACSRVNRRIASVVHSAPDIMHIYYRTWLLKNVAVIDTPKPQNPFLIIQRLLALPFGLNLGS